MRIELSIDPLQRDLDALGDALSRKAITRSLNRTAKSARTHTIRIVRRELNMKAADVRKNLKVFPARRSVTQAELVVAAEAVPLSRYGARQTRKGVTVMVKRKGGRKLVQGAFLARMKSGHLGVFTAPKGGYTRRGPAPNYSGLPIRERFSTALVQFIDDPKIVEEIGTYAREVFVKELAHNVEFLATQA